MRGLALAAAFAALAAPLGASAAGGLVFAPATLPAAKVGVRYQAVIRISLAGHHPALGRDYPSYTVACFGADGSGKFFDDCAKLPPGVKAAAFRSPDCAPPLRRPDCIALSGVPRKAGRYTFRISAPDVASAGVRGVVHRYTVLVRPA